ncbi:hypothetical protein PIB30_016819 [Stylosanthes scabra]|uniref:PB1-like domain-containing protein n=1 Tax=Stylosanthes scabra TaxID=79078 RepID=A0ABU6S7L3_9FABA|nr:hypothetical protein [Stylosanthes scabra]
MDTIDVVYHHGGEFVTSKDGVVVYEMETIDVEEKIDVDTLDVFAIRNHYLALGYEKIEECWWLVPGRSLQTGRSKLKTDADLLELVFHAQRNDNEIHIYYEHAVSVPELAEECHKLIEMTPTPTQIPTESPTVIDLESSPQRDTPTMSTQPLQPHVTPTQNSNTDTINPTKSNSNNKPKSSKPVVTKQVKPNSKPSVKSTTKLTVKPTVKPTSIPNMSNMKPTVRTQTRSSTRINLVGMMGVVAMTHTIAWRMRRTFLGLMSRGLMMMIKMKMRMRSELHKSERRMLLRGVELQRT